jgi:hypothetical protein
MVNGGGHLRLPASVNNLLMEAVVVDRPTPLIN